MRASFCVECRVVHSHPTKSATEVGDLSHSFLPISRVVSPSVGVRSLLSVDLELEPLLSLVDALKDNNMHNHAWRVAGDGSRLGYYL